MPTGIRLKRIQDQIYQVVSLLLETKVNDPRVEGAYVTDVSVDRDLDFANIYVSSLVGKEQADEILEGLQSAAGFFRYSLSQEIELRVMPKLRFFWDDTPENADRIDSLLAEIKKEREAREEQVEQPFNKTDDGDENV